MKESFMNKGGKNPPPPEGDVWPPPPPGQDTISWKIKALEKTDELLLQLRKAMQEWCEQRLEVIQQEGRDIEQLCVQLSGCSVAAAGWAKGGNDCKPGDYGWSVAFDDVKKLRAKYVKALEALKPFIEVSKRIPDFGPDVEDAKDMVILQWNDTDDTFETFGVLGNNFHRARAVWEELMGVG